MPNLNVKTMMAMLCIFIQVWRVCDPIAYAEQGHVLWEQMAWGLTDPAADCLLSLLCSLTYRVVAKFMHVT